MGEEISRAHLAPTGVRNEAEETMRQKSKMAIEVAPDSVSSRGSRTAAAGIWIGMLALPLLGVQPFAGAAHAQSTSSQSSSSHVQSGKDASSSDISINDGVVTVDGEAVPPDAHEFTSRLGNHYRINRNGDSVEVHQQ